MFGRKFKHLLIKEFKEIFGDRKLVASMFIPVILLPIIGLVFSAALSFTVKTSKIAVVYEGVDDDTVKLVRNTVVKYLRRMNVTVVELASLRDAVALGYDIVIYFNESLSNLLTDVNSTARAYVIVLRSQSAGTAVGIVSSALDVLNDAIFEWRLKALKLNVDPSSLVSPVREVQCSAEVVDSKVVIKAMSPEETAFTFGLDRIMYAFVVYIISFSPLMYATYAVAIEKERKTLEYLLTAPVRRTSILLSKVCASVILSAIQTAAIVAGYLLYMYLIFSGIAAVTAPAGGSEENIVTALMPRFTVVSGAVIVAALFAIVMFSSTLAMLLGLFGEDVRSAQSIASTVMMPLILSTLIAMFVVPEKLPLTIRVVVLAVPYVAAVEAMAGASAGNITYAIALTAYLYALTAVLLVIMARIFGTEKIFTMRLHFGRRRRTSR